MMMLLLVCFLALSIPVQSGVDAFSSPSTFRHLSRTASCSTFAGVGMPSSTALALEPCPPKSSNCIRTTWIPPKGTNKAAMAKTVKSVLAQYPQQGQNGVDKGGWKIVQDELNGRGTARVEFTSGLGIFAKLVNGNKPFIDDLAIEIGKDRVELRSSSRIGQSDLGVNAKRLQFLAKTVRAAGWEAPEPKY